ncbi:FAD-binding oxidoreductase [Cyclobacterium sp. SYSU L10401]|uniref:FAD-binding oxidoreductase n=1 Tax=Cyclobacterium sp. SYSU L10401 TaxID=2678657 RepID=UPI001F094D27|nr:FAD-binding oxidoreductase [Cyclobacterium sp. SYSU L10401]
MKTNELISDDKKIAEIEMEAFKSSLRGALLLPDQEGYDQSRTIWNGMFDKYPTMVVKCAGPSDVIAAVNFARENKLILAVKAGGHSFAGRSTCDGGLLIDLSNMKGIRVDSLKQTARAEAGALLSDLDHETQAFGLAVTAGVVSHTGIAGLTLGGGQGYLMNKFGLTIDNLLSVDMVLADGSFVKASKSENEDLFWAIRGGGGNFGVVTSLEYQLHKVGPEVLAGMILYPLDQAKKMLQFYREYSMNTPDEMSVIAGIFTLPDGVKVFGFVVCWMGDFDEGNRQLEPLRALPPPLADLIAPVPYVQLQKSFDAAVPHGMHRYNKMGYIPEITDELIDIIVRNTKEVSPYSMILFNVMKGAVTRVRPEDTPFPYRGRQWYFDITPQWVDPEEADSLIAWTRAFWDEVEPHTQGTAVNWLSPDDGLDRVKAAYGPNYYRLARLKHKYDPDNFFRLNNNILPNANG